jgi:hypothetical protein
MLDQPRTPYLVACYVYLALICRVAGEEPGPTNRELFARLDARISDVDALLKTFPGKFDGKRSLQRLTDLGREYDRLRRQLLDQPMALPDHQKQELFWEIHRRQSRLYELTKGHYRRLAPSGISKGAAAVFPFEQFNVKAILIARTQLEAVDTFLDAYKFQFDAYPKSLDDLVHKKMLSLRPMTEEDITDPWGRKLEYNERGPKNTGSKPDVWSLGPMGGSTNDVIGNWQDKN